CSRQIHSKDSAEFDHITEDNRLSQDTYNNGMSAETNSATRPSDIATVEKTPTSEMRLFWKRRQLKKKINVGHGNKKLKGSEGLDSINVNIPIPISPKLQGVKSSRRSLLKEAMMNDGRKTSKIQRRFLINSSENKRFLSSSQSTSLHNEDVGGNGIMEMDYSPAHKRPPIHNEVFSP
ncbi:hypothetical protein KI387_003474, partial [Taxus chinensis]